MECDGGFWSCAFDFRCINWQLRDDMERFLGLCALSFLRTSCGPKVAWTLACCISLAYYGLDYMAPSFMDHADVLCHGILYRLEIPAFLGLVLAVRRLVSAIPRDSLLMRPVVAAVCVGAGWAASAWVNRRNPANHCRARNVLDPSGDIPLLIGCCIFVRSFQVVDAMPSVQESHFLRTSSLISQLSLCIFAVEGPLHVFLTQGWIAGQPLTLAKRTDPLSDALFLGPGLALWVTLLAALVFCAVQRPARVLLESGFRYIEGNTSAFGAFHADLLSTMVFTVYVAWRISPVLDIRTEGLYAICGDP